MHLAMEQAGAESKTAPSQVEFRHVPADQLPVIWPQIEPMVKKALSCGQGSQTTLEHTIARVMTGEYRVWAALRDGDLMAAIFWSVREVDTGRKIWIEIISGKDLEIWLDDAMLIFKELAEEIGAVDVEASCRPGLARLLEKRGWKRKAVIMGMF